MDNKYEERLGTASMLPLILKMALPGLCGTAYKPAVQHS